MSSTPTQCREERRRHAVRAAERNGIDGVEVSSDGLTLTVNFLGKAPAGITPANIRITGGVRRVVEAARISYLIEEDPELDDALWVHLTAFGDGAPYTLHLVEPDPHGHPGTEPLAGIDPRYASSEFSFRQDCPTDTDCAPKDVCPEQGTGPVLDYLARDYGALRRLLLDRMSLLVPNWRERHVPDIGVALVELLAYVGDELSYQQDATASEAYLETARQRISVRRHTRLIDYSLHDGCNARAFVTLAASQRVTLKAAELRFLAGDVALPGPLVTPDQLAGLTPGTRIEVFEPVGSRDSDRVISVEPAHAEIRFWTWGDSWCALPRGATSATLRDEWTDEQAETNGARALRLTPGDVLVIEEVRGPRTGSPADADPRKRQAVRLTSVSPGVDATYRQPIVEIGWAPEDALTFAACLSARVGLNCELICDITVARGNAVLVDHGGTLDVPDEIPVPYPGTSIPSCTPPSFGCPDRQALDQATATVQRLIASTRTAYPLDVEDVRTLHRLVGEAAVVRAGIEITLTVPRNVEQQSVTPVPVERVLPETPAEQSEALERLLAQLSYPPVGPRFVPELLQYPVTHTAAFPDPAKVAAGQATVLAAIPGLARQWLRALRRAAIDGQAPGKADTAGLTLLFGAGPLQLLRLAKDPVGALTSLLARFDEFLAGKLSRLAALVARARSGTVLGDDVHWEIRHSWGEPFAGGLAATDPRLAGPARDALAQDPRTALPALYLRAGERTWKPRRDLLGSGPHADHVVGELTDAGRLRLRFGDGMHGASPPAGATLLAYYRVGNGTAGNVGADTITHLLLAQHSTDTITAVRNPMPAAGGTDPEPLAQARELAPLAVRRRLLRAVTAEDYADIASALPGIQRAAATLRHTGSYIEVHVAVDALGTSAPGEALLDAVAQALHPYRRIGHEVVVLPAELVPLDIAMQVCVAPGYQSGHVVDRLNEVLGSGLDGLFHPDALTFGAPVRASVVVARAAAVPGVASAGLTTFTRLFAPDPDDLADGLIRLGPLEVARLDNDPDRPDNGRLTIETGGGR